ncbi:biogenesis of lysosome-related organelles complex 1 subunit 4 [Sphaerodactylus townsendi]|uniref:Biogenesis of lysosome- organelles complex 1 subunit 4 n=1 Tax=Sphaerodactylus townsendi TaxID=933632 RepID=A0ACB8FCV6_9SAUR|nr:biogenesis of lysosome-related organelles complex 1 subunit 4 [Sphaerodactylus townsendi]
MDEEEAAAAAAEEPPPPVSQLSGDSGNVSQSHSSTSGLGDGEAATDGEQLLLAATADYAAYLLQPLDGSASDAQIRTLDKSLEELLTRVDEFVGMLDMIRSDSSQIVNESVPHIHAKAMEMRQLYKKIDKLEAFVKMVGNNVAGMEEHITKAEADLGAFPNTFRKLLNSINVPSFLNKSSSSRPKQSLYEPPNLFRTEDYFPSMRETQYT